jgi:hypothetical protein
VRADAPVVGWDIGGANVKASLADGADVRAVLSLPFSVQHDFPELPAALRHLHLALGAPLGAPHAVTMSAELSQRFRTKAEGVDEVLAAVERAFPTGELHVYTTGGTFVSAGEARRAPLTVAAANWVATAALVAERLPNAILLDTGTTTTDIIPLAGGRVAAVGRTDPERLASGELVYTGALRTPVEAIVRTVSWRGAETAVAADGFALAGDAHLWLGALSPDDYTVPTPDGRPATREFAGERLARMICADRTMVDDRDVDAIARAVAEAQIAQIAAAAQRVRARHPSIDTAVVVGVGRFLGAEGARRAGLHLVPPPGELGEGARHGPAAAVALLLSAMLRPDARASAWPSGRDRRAGGG